MTEQSSFAPPNAHEIFARAGSPLENVSLAAKNHNEGRRQFLGTGDILPNGLPGIDWSPERPGLVVSSDATPNTPARLVEPIKKAVGKEFDGTERWFDETIEIGARDAVKMLYARGFESYTSSVNADNFGPNKVADPHIGIKIRPGADVDRKLLERAEEMNAKESADAVENARNRAFNIIIDNDNPNADWRGAFIYLHGGDDMTVGEAAQKFTGIVDFITRDTLVQDEKEYAPAADKSHPIVDEDRTYDHIFNPSFPMEALRVSDAEVARPRGLSTILDTMKSDEWGTKSFGKEDGEAFNEFVRTIESYGVTQTAPSEEELQAMRNVAKSRVDLGNAAGFLRQQEYLDKDKLKQLTEGKIVKRHVLSWGNHGPLYIDPSLIVSAGNSLTDWSGRAEDGTKTYQLPGASDTKKGIMAEAISAYATFDSQLPALETNALQLILTDKGPVFYIKGSNTRTAAAKLRGEPMRFSSVTVHDVRG